MLFSDFTKRLQTALNTMGEKLTVDGDLGPKTKAALAKYEVDFLMKRVAEVTPAQPETPRDIAEWFGAPWVGVDLDLLGRDESDPELNRRYVPTFKRLVNSEYDSLMGNSRAWCAVRVVKALKDVGASVKGLTAGAASGSTYGHAVGFWFGAVLPIKHASGGRHICFFLYWIDEAAGICATLDGNKGNKFIVARTVLAKGKDQLVGGARWPDGWPDGQSPTMAQVLARYPQLKVGGSTSDSTR